MVDVLKFVFSSGWVYWGLTFWIVIVAAMISHIVDGILKR